MHGQSRAGATLIPGEMLKRTKYRNSLLENSTMNGVTINQLRCFDAVVTEGGFQAAAAKLRRTHSAVFTSIKNLESQLGLRLLDRDGYRVTLTDHGRALSYRARLQLAALAL